MTDRITTSCQHTHTVTLRLDEGEWPGYREVRLDSGPGGGIIGFRRRGWTRAIPPAIRAELEAALTAAEAACGGCGCAERLRAEALSLKAEDSGDAGWVGSIYDRAADFLDAAQDARGSDVSAACGCGHGWEYHGPEVPGCAECRCRRVMEAADG